MAAAIALGCNKSGQPSEPSAAQPSPPSGADATSSPAAPVSNFAPGSDAGLVRQAIEDHVRNDRGISLSAMDMSVDSVHITGNQAQANVTFRIKQGDQTMVMVYSLERRGNGWLVTKDEPANGGFVHPTMDQTHSAAPPTSSGSAMPDVHEFLKNHPATTTN